MPFPLQTSSSIGKSDTNFASPEFPIRRPPTHLRALGWIFALTGPGLLFSQFSPPTLSSITITPNTINVTSSAATFSVDLGIVDPSSAFNWGLIWFTSPSGNQRVSANPNPAPLSGTIYNGVFRAIVTIPQGAEAGVWTINNITLIDTAGNNHAYPATTDLIARGFQTNVTVADQHNDVTPPALVSLAITTNEVNVDLSPATFSVDLHITDDNTGFNWGLIWFTSPSGSQSVSANPNARPVSGTAANGIFRANVTIPRGAESGVWTITNITLIDGAGNYGYPATADLISQGSQVSVTITDQHNDTTPPALTWVAITPNQVNVGQSAATFYVDLSISDDNTGFNWGLIWFTSPSGNQQATANPNPSPRSGTATNGTFRASFSLPQGAETGVWTITNMTLIDGAGNNANFTTADLIAQGFRTSVTVTVQAPPAALGFVPITPCRVVDTRKAAGPFGGPSIQGQSFRSFLIPGGACPVPGTAQAYSLNVAVVPQSSLGYLTVWPTGQAQPLTATLNSDTRVKSSGTIVPAGAGGGISIFAANTADVVVDINGYFVPAANSGALGYYPLTPCRISDSRKPIAPLGGPYLGGQVSRTLPILSSSCGVPSTARAYSMNLTAVPHGPLGFMTAWPTGQPRPSVASLNAGTGTTTSNAAIVPAGTGGSIDLFATNDTDLVIDINGYFAPQGAGGLLLYNVQPCRVLDTRKPPGAPPFSGTMTVNVTDSGCGTPITARAYVVNATVVPPAPLGFLTLWAQGAAQPVVSSLNAVDGAITGNMAIVPTTNGSISAFATSGTHLVMDLFGYFAP